MVKRLSQWILRAGLMPVLSAGIHLYFRTIRFVWSGEERVRAHLEQGGRLVCAIWHQRIFLAVGYAVRFASYAPSVMISRSRDGDMIADVYSRLGLRPVRGSSSAGGRRALTALVEDLETHQIAVHVVDGPQGPKGIVKGGLVRLAQRSGVLVFPVYLSGPRLWILRSWDRCLVPKPFSTVSVRWGEPLLFPEETDGAAFERCRREIEARMQEEQGREDLARGWPAPL